MSVQSFPRRQRSVVDRQENTADTSGREVEQDEGVEEVFPAY